MKAAAAKVASEEGTLIDKLKQATWPANTKVALSNLESTAAKERTIYTKCAAAAGVPQIKQILTSNRALIAARVAAAQHVRVALGLPATGR